MEVKIFQFIEHLKGVFLIIHTFNFFLHLYNYNNNKLRSLYISLFYFLKFLSLYNIFLLMFVLIFN